MSLKLKLMYPDPETNIFDGIEVIEEQNKLGSGNSLYIQGPYTGTCKNKNGRVYPKEELSRDLNRYITEMVKTNRALGELNHSQTAEVNPERASHIVTELVEDGDTWYGKSKVLTGDGLPCGNLVKGLINNGVSLGVSTRSLGTLEESSEGHNIVRNLHVVAFDCVADPSFPKAFVNGILESKEWIVDGGHYEELYEGFEGSLAKLPKKDVDEFLRGEIIKFINALG